MSSTSAIGSLTTGVGKSALSLISIPSSLAQFYLITQMYFVVDSGKVYVNHNYNRVWRVEFHL